MTTPPPPPLALPSAVSSPPAWGEPVPSPSCLVPSGGRPGGCVGRGLQRARPQPPGRRRAAHAAGQRRQPARPLAGQSTWLHGAGAALWHFRSCVPAGGVARVRPGAYAPAMCAARRRLPRHRGTAGLPATGAHAQPGVAITCYNTLRAHIAMVSPPTNMSRHTCMTAAVVHTGGYVWKEVHRVQDRVEAGGVDDVVEHVRCAWSGVAMMMGRAGEANRLVARAPPKHPVPGAQYFCMHAWHERAYIAVVHPLVRLALPASRSAARHQFTISALRRSLPALPARASHSPPAAKTSSQYSNALRCQHTPNNRALANGERESRGSGSSSSSRAATHDMYI